MRHLRLDQTTFLTFSNDEVKEYFDDNLKTYGKYYREIKEEQLECSISSINYSFKKLQDNIIKKYYFDANNFEKLLYNISDEKFILKYILRN